MDIQQTVAPAAAKPKPAAVEKSDKAASAQETRGGAMAAPAFSQLLQGLQGDAGVLMDSPLAVHGTHQGLVDAALGQQVQDLQPLLGMESLVGQTRQLDLVDVDAAVQDGSFLLAQQDAGWLGATGQWVDGAQPHVAAGQSVATVAAGVQSVVAAPAQAGTSTAAALASIAVAEASGLAESVVQAVSEGLQSDQASEGRVALQGAWKLEDPHTALTPALQRLMGQVEQWAAASAGVQPKATERAESAKSAAQATEWLSAGQGSGTRLTDSAVQEAQAAQDAVLDTLTEAPEEDMRFWLQGKQQRAEVVLEKDGQPVRVQVAVRGNEAHVTFRADQAQTRELLDASLAQLREMLEQQGVQLAGVSVQADAQGQASSDQGSRSPWGAMPAQHATVAVPTADAPAVRTPRAQGVDLYA